MGGLSAGAAPFAIFRLLDLRDTQAHALDAAGIGIDHFDLAPIG